MGAAGAFMGGLGQLMGGNSQSDGSTSSNTTGSSSNQSQNSSLQASQSNSGSVSSNRSGSNNQAYGAIDSALNPSLGYVTSAGNMMAALLGLPQSTATYGGPAVSPLPAAAPAPQVPTSSTGAATTSTINSLLNKYLTAAPPSVPVAAAPAPTPVPVPAPTPPPTTTTPPSGGYLGGGYGGYSGASHYAAQGGEVRAHKPVIVGEHQPEVFVPKTDGMILPQVPGMGPDGRAAPPGSPPSGSNLGLMLHLLGVPHREGGGQVQAGSPVVVGERQPETFVPAGGPTMMPGMVPGVPGSMGTNPTAGSGPMFGGPSRSLLGTMFGGGFGHYPGPGPGPIPAPGGNTPPPVTPPGVTPPPASAAPPLDATGALSNFANSAGEQFLLNQGQQAISGASAGNGTFDSGATGKALDQFGQNLGSTYLNDYMNHLSQYAQLGLGGASAMTGAGGVSQSTGGTTSTAGSTSLGTSQGTAAGSSSNNSNANGSTNSSSKQGLGI